MDTCCSRFTAAEGGARLAAVASMKNIIITEHCSFVATRLLHEEAYKIRGLFSQGRQRSVFLTRPSRIAYVSYELGILTDLSIGHAMEYEDVEDWRSYLDEKQVIVCTSRVLKSVLEDGYLSVPQINVLIIDSCHLICMDEDLRFVMKHYKLCKEINRPRLLALTYPLFTSIKAGNDDENKDTSDDKSDVEDKKSGSDETLHEGEIVEMDQTDDGVKKNSENDVDNIDVHLETVDNIDIALETVDHNTNVAIKEMIEEDNAIQSIMDKVTEKDPEFELCLGVYRNYDDFDMYEKLGWKIEELEKDLSCEMDLAEDIEGGKRLSSIVTKPREVIIEYGKDLSMDDLTEVYKDLDQFMRITVQDAMEFINEHRYDPSEIYGDDLYEEFINIPDPTLEPKEIFHQFLYILDELGPYGADKAAFSLLSKLEKLKIKVPYERHFLLLCMCTTTFVKIRSYADDVFSKYPSDWDKMRAFCTPKVLRLAEILELFRPVDSGKGEMGNVDGTNISIDGKDDTKSLKVEEMLNIIDECDFTTLGNQIEDRVNTYKLNLKDIDDVTDISDGKKANDGKNTSDTRDLSDNRSVSDNKNLSDGRNSSDSKVMDRFMMNSAKIDEFRIVGVRGPRQRVRGRARVPRNYPARIQQNQLNPDALCGIMFLKEPLMAKIMFMLIADMSRFRTSLNYISAQYCAVDVSGNELQECQRQSRKQEDVLKRFRMHECNLLLATSALEEGIDLPRCNLVVRWDVPPSYRSHTLCRGRARAPRSSLALLAESQECSKLLLHHLAIYRELDQIITRKCGCGIQDEPPPEEEIHADEFTQTIKAYSPDVVEEQDTNIHLSKTSKNYIEEISKVERTTINGNNLENVIKLIENSIQNVTNGSRETELHSERDELVNGTIEEINTKVRKINDTLNEIDAIRKSNAEVINSITDQTNCICLDDNEMVSGNVDNVCEIISNDDSEDTSDPCVDKFKVTDSEGVVKSVSVDDSDKTKKTETDSIASVDLSTAIALINRYCGKLPSDTFTRLAPQWWMEEVQLADSKGEMRTAYICTLRLPLNCPVKYNIVGHPMPTRVLARRMVALQACRILHKSGELDNQLMPIGKENFKAAELENANLSNSNNVNGEPTDPNDSARPGTTKRRQYYFKRTALAFTDCQPMIDTSDSEIESTTDRKYDPAQAEFKPGVKRNTLYAIDSRLWCALPERYNTRGRRLHAPQHASQAIGILMARHQPDKLQIPAFPVYTRSGEVRVSVELAEDADVRLSPRRARLVRRFMRFVFSDVLRVRRRGMKLQSEGSTHNNYYIVPTIKTTNEDGTSKVDIDWEFLELIYKHTEEKRNIEVEKPVFFQDEEDEDVEEKKVESKGKEKDGKVKKMDNPLLKPGETFTFDPEKYKEAVVTPWYRNQDQPQFFLVAEICWNLSPDSAFPSATHTTFRDYYNTKYGVTLTQPNQPLLDVDHTSARLNLLTPRYVNRKGVALPVSSERTRRAKRDRLDQKQILVPELCRVHPFAAPLWFATVVLPCVLYRINALLIADEIRRAVAIDVGLGIPKIDGSTCPGFQWPPLDFGWSLAEVLNTDSEKSEKKKMEDDGVETTVKDLRELRALEEKVQKEVEEKVEEAKEKTINDILQEKEEVESCFEIGTWSNDMASSIPEAVEYDEYLEPLPPNLTFCTSASGGANWNEPIEKPKVHYGASRTFSVADSDCSYMSSDFDTDDSDMNTDGSDEDTDTGFCSSKNSNAAMGVRIEYKTAHEAEAVDVERARSGPPAPQPSRADDQRDLVTHRDCLRAACAPPEYIEKFRETVKQHEKDIVDKGFLFDKDRKIIDLLPDTSRDIDKSKQLKSIEKRPELEKMFPYGTEAISFDEGQITIESIERNKRLLLEKLKKSMREEDIKKMNCFSMRDVNIDSPGYVNEKLVNVGFDHGDSYKEKIEKWRGEKEFQPYYQEVNAQNRRGFDFDYQPVLEGHPGPSPSVILQALTMSNANDGINLERLETIGDSFLKFAITAYLYCAHPTVHEGKLSHMRSKQVSNLNLYRLGRGKRLGARMTASKFEPHDNWLPPCHRAPPTLHQRPGEAHEQSAAGDGPVDHTGCFIPYNLITQHSIPDKSIADCVEALIGAYLLECGPRGALLFMSWLGIKVLPRHDLPLPENHPYVIAHKDNCRETAVKAVKKSPSPPSPKPQQKISDSESDWNDDEEAEIETDEDQCRQQELGPEEDWSWSGRAVGSLKPYKTGGGWYQPIFGELRAPPSPLLRYIEDPEGELEQMLSGYEALESTLQYRFKDRSLLLQALTHASHQRNRLTDCYQRLEFLGDAILDYLITRHLYEDARRHSPGALTDLRSALVNNTIFATLAARHGFHKYFRHMSPGLNEVLTKYVKIQEENGHSISEEHYLIHEDEMEQAEDVEVPKALGDLFESVAGAIFLDSGMSLGAVWRSYVRLMGAELEAFSAAAPKSPVRELLEAEPDTAKFGKPERLADGRRVRVCVEVFGRGAFKGVGRNYRIAKGTAARCALRHLKIHRAR